MYGFGGFMVVKLCYSNILEFGGLFLFIFEIFKKYKFDMVFIGD